MKMEALRGFGEWELVPLACGQPTSRAVPKTCRTQATNSLVAGLGQRDILFDGPPSRARQPDGGGDSAALKRVFVLE